jgi:hypothetical protein
MITNLTVNMGTVPSQMIGSKHCELIEEARTYGSPVEKSTIGRINVLTRFHFMLLNMCLSWSGALKVTHFSRM